MTTTSQQTVLSSEELDCLRSCAQGRIGDRDAPMLQSLAAKGMLQGEHGRYALTPAAEHLLHHDPGMLPGIDN
jgi:hypothetical protein